jgi:hypothetical protein
MGFCRGAKAANSTCPLPQTLQQIETFLGTCGTSQTLPRTLDAHQIYVLCRNLTERVIQDNCARLAIDLMVRAIGLIAENPHQLTEIHHLLLWVCFPQICSAEACSSLTKVLHLLFLVVLGESAFQTCLRNVGN